MGFKATVGNSATVGDSAKVGNYATVGYYATVGDNATVGNYATVGNHIVIGNYCKIEKAKAFSELDVFLKTGIIMQNGEGTFYKAVSPELKAMSDYGNEYQYTEGGSDSMQLKRDSDLSCGPGWHFTSLHNAVSFAAGKPHRIISATVKLKDIMAIHDKIRVRAYSNVQIVKLFEQAEKGK